MAATEHGVEYHFNLGVSIGEANTSLQSVMTAAAGMTDATAIALQRAWLALPWASGASTYAYCTKHDVINQMTDGNAATGVFS